MAKKVTLDSLGTAIDKMSAGFKKQGKEIQGLARLVEKGFAATAYELSLRPTKNDVVAIIENTVPDIVREETKDIRAELTAIRRDLEHAAAKIDNLSGLPKEIDHALERIAAIEKHLGLSQKIAA